MFYINDIYQNEIIINKSKFIATIIPINNIIEANQNLAKIKEKYFDATHNCYAYIIGDNCEIQKYSDDGEPQKTAGAPILEALKKNNVTNILAVVTRYFGGTLLGASGLIRAYQGATIEVLKKALFYQKELFLEFNIALSYKEYNSFIKLSYINITDTLFQSDILVKAQIIASDKDRLYRDLFNIIKDKIELIFKEVYSLKKAE